MRLEFELSKEELHQKDKIFRMIIVSKEDCSNDEVRVQYIRFEKLLSAIN